MYIQKNILGQYVKSQYTKSTLIEHLRYFFEKKIIKIKVTTFFYLCELHENQKLLLRKKNKMHENIIVQQINVTEFKFEGKIAIGLPQAWITQCKKSKYCN